MKSYAQGTQDEIFRALILDIILHFRLTQLGDPTEAEICKCVKNSCGHSNQVHDVAAMCQTLLKESNLGLENDRYYVTTAGIIEFVLLCRHYRFARPAPSS
ncbi:MAG: hypothetical protein K0S38_183 [Candidatus Paceibacter sp.]|jgi:hypothetical protein|nr:hypothetical protein [Candidatus Paceibacter sp.]